MGKVRVEVKVRYNKVISFLKWNESCTVLRNQHKTENIQEQTTRVEKIPSKTKNNE